MKSLKNNNRDSWVGRKGGFHSSQTSQRTAYVEGPVCAGRGAAHAKHVCVHVNECETFNRVCNLYRNFREKD